MNAKAGNVAAADADYSGVEVLAYVAALKADLAGLAARPLCGGRKV